MLPSLVSKIIIFVGPLDVGVQPVARRGGDASIRLLTGIVCTSGRPIRLVVEVVEVDLLLVERGVLTVVGLLEHVGLQLLLSHLVSIYFALVLRFRQACLSIPTRVG